MPEKKPRVVLYTSPICTYCHVVKIFLKKNNVGFEEVDISESEAKGKELEEKAGVSTVPVTFVGKEFVVGFDRARLKKLLGL